MAPWSQAPRAPEPLRGPGAAAPLAPGSREGSRLTAQPRAVAVFYVVPASSLRAVLVSPRSGPRRGPRTLSPAQAGLQLRSETRRRRATRPPNTDSGAVSAPAAPLLPARHPEAPARRRYHPFLARHFLPSPPRSARRTGTPPCWSLTFLFLHAV